uniref:Macro domain-containing protein n=1 Tax=Pygocentrus nattereri TaxID=42514 RepID=A0A3B4D9Z4_PYGNA
MAATTMDSLSDNSDRSHAFSFLLSQKLATTTAAECFPLRHFALCDASNKGTIMPEIKYSKQLSRGSMISVWKDDLTTHKADAVVNKANEHLNHEGGLALALCRAGGPQIQQMSDEIIKVQGRVATGEAVLTPAGNLPCKYIIHAVGPCKTIWSIFQITIFNNLQSVAIPTLNSGPFNFSHDLCADIIVSCVRSLAEKLQPQSTSLEIRLVNNDDPTVQEMLRACKEVLGPSDKVPSPYGPV